VKACGGKLRGVWSEKTGGFSGRIHKNPKSPQKKPGEKLEGITWEKKNHGKGEFSVVGHFRTGQRDA